MAEFAAPAANIHLTRASWGQPAAAAAIATELTGGREGRIAVHAANQQAAAAVIAFELARSVRQHRHCATALMALRRRHARHRKWSWNWTPAMPAALSLSPANDSDDDNEMEMCARRVVLLSSSVQISSKQNSKTINVEVRASFEQTIVILRQNLRVLTAHPPCSFHSQTAGTSWDVGPFPRLPRRPFPINPS